jgi:ribosomal protein S18 acetylase RimI-like enzyme
MAASLQIRKVGLDSLPAILGILQETALWLQDKGIDQWQPFLDAEEAKNIVTKRFGEGEVFLGFLDRVPVATITLQWRDEFWAEMGLDAESGYIHTMAVSRSHAGLGLGKELLDWAQAYFSEAGKLRMRLDCIEKNLRLCRYYDQLGFKSLASKQWQNLSLLLKERSF